MMLSLKSKISQLERRLISEKEAFSQEVIRTKARLFSPNTFIWILGGAFLVGYFRLGKKHFFKWGRLLKTASWFPFLASFHKR